jgi:hypothetical protein
LGRKSGDAAGLAAGTQSFDEVARQCFEPPTLTVGDGVRAGVIRSSLSAAALGRCASARDATIGRRPARRLRVRIDRGGGDLRDGSQRDGGVRRLRHLRTRRARRRRRRLRAALRRRRVVAAQHGHRRERQHHDAHAGADQHAEQQPRAARPARDDAHAVRLDPWLMSVAHIDRRT